jgi:hypothetical protein
MSRFCGFARMLALIAPAIAVGGLPAWSVGAFDVRSPITAFLVPWFVVVRLATVALSMRFALPSA